ncbi:MAG TPA: alpha/beta hydrolase [Chloroflexia bacterium]|nr:alpha/beta hydrolase [Chloroflexia bacterium]
MANGMFLNVNGHSINYLSSGKGPRTFLAHSGWVGTWEDWQPQLQALSAKYKAVGYDHRGAGYTQAAVEDITAEGIVDDVFGVMDALGLDKCVLGGFSTGAKVVLSAALKQPERFEGLVLMCGVFPTTPPELSQRLKSSAEMILQNYEAYIRQMALAFTPEPDPNIETIRYWIQGVLRKTPPAQAARLLETLYSIDISAEQLRQITIPTLLIHGTSDPFGPVSAGKYMATHLPNSQLALIEGGGHVCAITRSDQVNEAIEKFIEGLS